jgi:hypothetical protein
MGRTFARLSALDARRLFPSMARCSGSRKKIDAKITSIIDFAEDSFNPADAESPSTGKIKCSKGIEHF